MTLRTAIAGAIIIGFAVWILRPSSKYAAVGPGEKQQEAKVVAPSPTRFIPTTSPRGNDRVVENRTKFVPTGVNEQIPIHEHGGCRRDEDCPSNYVCFPNRPPYNFGHGMLGMCFVRGDCRTDSDCGPSAHCVIDNGVPQCIHYGRQRQGLACRIDAIDPALQCGPGLTCFQGRCEAGCQKAGEQCANGGDCVDTETSGLLCTEPCDSSKCKTGQQCMHTPLGQRCATAVGRDCTKPENACQSDELCDARFYFDGGGTNALECRLHCQSDDDCRSGQVCGWNERQSAKVCYRPCSTSKDCGGGRCVVIDSGEHGVRGCVLGPSSP